MNFAFKFFLILLSLSSSLFCQQPPLRKSQNLEIPTIFVLEEPNSYDDAISSLDVTPKSSDSPIRRESPERIREESSILNLNQQFNAKSKELDDQLVKTLALIHNGNLNETQKQELLNAFELKKAAELKELTTIIIKIETKKLNMRKNEIILTRDLYYEFPGAIKQVCHIEELKNSLTHSHESQSYSPFYK